MNISFGRFKVSITFPFVAFLSGSVIFDKSGAVIWGLLSALLHEMGHIAAMSIKGGTPYEIQFKLFDISILDKNRIQNGYKDDILILAAGSAVNILMFCFLYIVYKITKLEFLHIPMTENLFLGIMNILPIESLDGGQILYAILCLKGKEKSSSTVLQVVSFMVLVPLTALGFYILIKSNHNFSLLMISCYLMALVLLKQNRFY